MHNQRGFIGIGILIAILVGLAVLGGGAYYVVQQQSPMQTASENTVSWEIYKNNTWGIEFKYPSNFVLNTVPNEFWKNFTPYRNGTNFFELIDNQRGCYVGPVKAVGLGYAPSKELSIKTFSGDAIEVKYWTSSDGAVLFGLTNYVIPDNGYQLNLNVTSLSGDLIESNYKNASANRSVNSNCVKDFETILTTLKFTKQSAPTINNLSPTPDTPKTESQNNADGCDIIANSTFRSIGQYEVGLLPDGPGMGYWRIQFQKGTTLSDYGQPTFQWRHSDISESGTYTCKNNVLQMKFKFTARYDVSKKILTWDGVEYKKVE